MNDSPIACGWCDGDGDTVNPANADPDRPLLDWLPPVRCPRCGGSGIDPNPDRPMRWLSSV